MSGSAAPLDRSPARRRLVFITHPQPRADHVCARLREAGLAAHALPAFGLRPLAPEALADAAARLSDYDIAVMVSPTAVAMLTGAAGGRPWPARTLAAVVGRGSRDALMLGPGPPARVSMPEGSADAEALLAEPEMSEVVGKRILLVRGETGRDEFAQTLRARGATVDELRAYARTEAPWPEPAATALFQAAAQASAAVFVFTTTSAAARVEQALADRGAAALAWARACPALAVHPRIASSLHQGGWTRACAIEPGVDALVAALESG
mgnify:CR=1 FL=1